jgi:hypothetical protein
LAQLGVIARYSLFRNIQIFSRNWVVQRKDEVLEIFLEKKIFSKFFRYNFEISKSNLKRKDVILKFQKSSTQILWFK